MQNCQRRPFDARLSFVSQVVTVPSIRSMSNSDLENMIRAFNRYGFVIISCEKVTDSREDLLALKHHFGGVAPHQRADADGIVPINAFSKVNGFIGSTAEEHPLHTDGAFLDVPEVIMTLQCATPATFGGVSRLASAQAAYAHLAAAFPGRIQALERPDALTIRRRRQTSTQSLFLRCGSHHRGIRFRMPDGAAEITPHQNVRELYNELCRFLTSPENILELKLQSDQVLIVDNTALVHGRSAYPPSEPRYMRRLNFDATGPLCDRMVFGFALNESCRSGAGRQSADPISA
jgi:alpha-ketoglutarate-dependent taurine dioxygenase